MSTTSSRVRHPYSPATKIRGERHKNDQASPAALLLKGDCFAVAYRLSIAFTSHWLKGDSFIEATF